MEKKRAWPIGRRLRGDGACRGAGNGSARGKDATFRVRVRCKDVKESRLVEDSDKERAVRENIVSEFIYARGEDKGLSGVAFRREGAFLGANVGKS
jgi:hypothetical protein